MHINVRTATVSFMLICFLVSIGSIANAQPAGPQTSGQPLWTLFELFQKLAAHKTAQALGAGVAGVFATLIVNAFRKQREAYGGNWDIEINWSPEAQNLLIGDAEPTLRSEGEINLSFASRDALCGYAVFSLKKGSGGEEELLGKVCVYVHNVTFDRCRFSHRNFPYILPLVPKSWEQTIEMKIATSKHPNASNYFKLTAKHQVDFDKDQVTTESMKGKISAIVDDRKLNYVGRVTVSRV
jgi:hypothetical protein